MQHAIIKALFHNKNYFAPLKSKKPKRMLDIGCGTGVWCIEMGMFTSHEALPQLLTKQHAIFQTVGYVIHTRLCDRSNKQQVEGIDLSPIQPEK
jgi:hypothetical protein